MGNERTNIEQLISSSERIGTIGSPSSTSELSLEILGTVVNKKLVRELAFFRFSQDGKPHYALGKITEVQLKNIWLEDPTMRSLARQRGQVNPVNGQQDTHLGDITVNAVFCDDGNRFEPSILGTVPATGTSIHLATDQILDRLLERYGDEIFYLHFLTCWQGVAKGIENVHFEFGDAAKLLFEDNSIDFIVSTGSLHHWKEPIKV